MLVRSCTLLLLNQITFVNSLSPHAQSRFTNVPTENSSSDFAKRCFDPSVTSRTVPAIHQDCIDTSEDLLKRNGNLLQSRSFGGQRSNEASKHPGSRPLSVEDDRGLADTVIHIPNRKGIVARRGFQSPSHSFDDLFLDLPKGTVEPTLSKTIREVDAKKTTIVKPETQNLTYTITNNSSAGISGEDGDQSLNTTTVESNRSSVSGTLECYDPPSLRERAYPVQFSDCEKATVQIIGNRDQDRSYIFTRKWSRDRYYYPLPVKYTYGSCVVYLDMIDDSARDKVKLRFVEASAWVLAHKCSGEEISQFKYGGTMTVSVGANDSIRVYVYGTWPWGLNGNPASSSLQKK